MSDNDGRRFFRQWRLAFALLLALGGLLARPAAAHTGGRLQLGSQPAGPFQLTVWTSPEPARVGPLHVAAAVVTAAAAAPVLDAQVTVTLAPHNGSGESLTAAATTETSDVNFLYEAIMEPATAGEYVVTVDVAGADGSRGQVAFDLAVAEAAGFSWLYLIPLVLGMAALALFAAAWRNSRGQGSGARD